MTTTTRPWPQPADDSRDKRDFIIRDPVSVAYLVRCANSGMPGASAALDIINDHNAAADAMAGMQAVWLRFRAGERA
jgi:hypothetical protein